MVEFHSKDIRLWYGKTSREATKWENDKIQAEGSRVSAETRQQHIFSRRSSLPLHLIPSYMLFLSHYVSRAWCALIGRNLVLSCHVEKAACNDAKIRIINNSPQMHLHWSKEPVLKVYRYVCSVVGRKVQTWKTNTQGKYRYLNNLLKNTRSLKLKQFIQSKTYISVSDPST